jgi:hypothetical protein
VIGIAVDNASPKLVLALVHGDGELHHLGRLGMSFVILSGPLITLGLRPECPCPPFPRRGP